MAELTFSMLKILKINLRNTESRLVGLALLSIHRDINVHDEVKFEK